MKPIFLTANGLNHQEVVNAFSTMISHYLNMNKAIIITTADKEYKEKNYHAENTYKLLFSMGFKAVDFIDIEFDDPQKLRQYDLIYINGGNPFYLLHHLRNSKTNTILTELRDKSIIVGHSAGAAVLGTSIKHAMMLHPEWNDINIEDFTGLKLIDKVILPHSNRYQELDERVKDLNPILLEDNNYMIF
ncbi:peptidase [Paenibacillus albiflavus]|uniref:Peptidase n=1 Tax=Paenibacillus albiflavus TaxID=2545760 RepID=A0A4R4EJ84_9BACL|nr:Type 1 glutamine amidotransferase-like domain-containing protein [Paenibacillus albiflavus]TCZ79310.1 peptidase [Paenibacillus albiflavus]